MTARRGIAAAVLATLLCLSACGGGDGPSGPAPLRHPPGATTFIGHVSRAAAASERASDLILAADVQAVVQVCVAGTGFCTTVDDSGAFTLAANVGGDVVLLFDGPNFSARLSVNDVPRGATVRVDAIVCDPASGICEAGNVQIVAPANAPPDCSAAVARPAILWPPNHDLVRIAIVGVVDPDGDPLAITATDITQNEPVDVPGSGNTAPDAQLDPLAVRAERSGQGDGRLYAIDFVADDGRGGHCAGTVLVCVPHDRGHGAMCN